MAEASRLGDFKGFHLKRDMSFYLLQFADETIMFCDGTNLWSVKVLLRSFELVLGLKINLAKSKIYGLNLKEEFIASASTYLLRGV